jgi:hypothetical protein
MLIIRGQAAAKAEHGMVEDATAVDGPPSASRSAAVAPSVNGDAGQFLEQAAIIPYDLEPAEPVPHGFGGIKAANGSRPKVSAAKPERSRHAKGHPTPEAAAREFYREIGRGEAPSLNEIQQRLHVGIDKARSYRTHFLQMIENQRVAV